MAYGNKSKSMKNTKKYTGKAKALPIAQKALRMAKSNRSFAFVDYAINDTFTGSNTPEVFYIVPPNNTGGGDRQTIQELEFNLSIKRGSNDDTFWRVDVVLDRMPSKVALTITDVYDVTTPSVTALLSFDNRERYKICKSYQGYFSSTETNNQRFLKFKIRSGLVTEADGTTFTQSKVLKNAYYLVYWSDVTSGFPTIKGDYRITSLIT